MLAELHRGWGNSPVTPPPVAKKEGTGGEEEGEAGSAWPSSLGEIKQ
jgi:hypothetical protein